MKTFVKLLPRLNNSKSYCSSNLNQVSDPNLNSPIRYPEPRKNVKRNLINYLSKEFRLECFFKRECHSSGRVHLLRVLVPFKQGQIIQLRFTVV